MGSGVDGFVSIWIDCQKDATGTKKCKDSIRYPRLHFFVIGRTHSATAPTSAASPMSRGCSHNNNIIYLGTTTNKVERTMCKWCAGYCPTFREFYRGLSPNVKADVLKACQKDGRALQHAAPNLQDDYDVVLASVKQYGGALRFASPSLQDNRHIVEAAVLQHDKYYDRARAQGADATVYASKRAMQDRIVLLALAQRRPQDAMKRIKGTELENNLEMVMTAITAPGGARALAMASSGMRDSENVVLAALQAGVAMNKAHYKSAPAAGLLNCISKRLLNDKPFVLRVVSLLEELPSAISSALRNDRDVAVAGVQKEGGSLRNAGEAPRRDRMVCLAAVRSSGEALQFSALRDDEEVVMAAVQNCGTALRFASPELRDNKQIVLAAVEQTGIALRWASCRLKSDREVVLVALENHKTEAWSRKPFTSVLTHASQDLRADRGLVLSAVSVHGEEIQWASGELKADFEVALNAASNGDVFQQLPLHFRDNKPIVLVAVSRRHDALQHASERLKADIDVAKTAVEFSPLSLQYAAESCKADRGVVLVAVQNVSCWMDRIFKEIPESFKSDREFILDSLRMLEADSSNTTRILKYASDTLRQDPQFAFAAIRTANVHSRPLSFMSANLKADRRLNLAAVQKYGYALREAPDEMRDDREVVLTALRTSSCLQFASARLRDDFDLVEVAVASSPSSLEHASLRLRGDVRLVMTALARSTGSLYFALRHASGGIKADQRFMLECVEKDGLTLEIASPKLRCNREIALAAVKSNACALHYVSEDLKHDEEVLIAAMQDGANKRSLFFDTYVPEAMRNNRSIVLAAVRGAGESLRFASSAFRKDPEIVLSAIETYGEAFRYADDSLKSNRQVVVNAIQRNPVSLSFASDELKRDRSLRMAALSSNGDVLAGITDGVETDRELILTAVRNLKDETVPGAKQFLKFVAPHLRNDRGVVLELVKRRGQALWSVPDKFKGDEAVVMTAIHNYPAALSAAALRFRKDKDLVMEAARKDGTVLRVASRELQVDEEVALAAVTSAGQALQFVPRAARTKAMALAAIKQNKKEASKFVPWFLKEEREVAVALGLAKFSNHDIVKFAMGAKDGRYIVP
ncbi:expressed unknown protein [Seminavis robusta]|uniref:DUF4116 domain-containing protein n=1 Tax=Seminavis robusta TaxID=568900 RepID=A0A9N8E954_9STRA|nr:expressed unknown protein [Seminavis robusta]|eukprot:Sro763_g198950.1 n/a (1099) ;mRNA; r:35733-39103